MTKMTCANTHNTGEQITSKAQFAMFGPTIGLVFMNFRQYHTSAPQKCIHCHTKTPTQKQNEYFNRSGSSRPMQSGSNEKAAIFIANKQKCRAQVKSEIS
mmetsp:Transcript_115319/g.180158  ORF Transcript_115319/g.180158 Transcript_115319/m.180158 type:complete len:100 (-) Transcript_115319:1586-1885(-)